MQFQVDTSREVPPSELDRQIVRRADPITLYWNGSPWFVHPPLGFWLSAATGALLGFSETTARLWSALFGAAGVLVTYLLGRRLYDHRTGILSGLILATSLEYVILARGAGLDMPLLAFMLAAFYMVVVAEAHTESAARRRAYRWAFVWAGLATLSKGPIGLLLPGLVIGAWWLLLGVGRQRLRTLPWDGLVIYAAVGLSWYAVEAVRHGMPFLRQVVGYYMFTRFFGVVENQPGPWYYYVPVLLVAAFLLFPAALLAPGRGDDPEAWHRILSHAVPVMACLALMAPADGLQWIWRFAVQGAGDTRWPLVVLVLLSVVCLAVPIWWVPALAGDQALVWCYLLLAVYVWIVAGAMAWRFYRGPWAGMNVRS